jgi:hypothetical protein
MKFTLKDYQEDALADVLDRLRKARRRWHEDRDRHAFSLTAVTGAGKTVIAAAAFEALFHGNDDLDFDPDPGAVVIWFSDDPSLNEQTRFRLSEASDRLNPSDLVVVGSTFSRDKFQAGKIYFLNTQKLGKKSLLVRGDDAADESSEVVFPEMRPDIRQQTIWDTIQNTIDDDQLTLYLVLDEAHRGMGSGSSQDKATIVKRLINGRGPVPPIPIVWGISATVDRFNKAMAGAEGRSTLPNVVVDPEKVQDSGLLKDTIVLDVPDEEGHFDTVLVRRATDKIIESSAAWAEYATQEQEAETVLPLLVMQVRNTPDHNEIGRAIDTILERWSDLAASSIAHVFGEHTSQTFGRYEVPYISPERVQDETWVRVLIAKDAISTGWDCPRAEVMVSFRPAQEPTHITQLLGRMVRTPLARRIPGNDRLNSVDCLLPFFDEKAVKKVADTLMRGGGDSEEKLPGRRVLSNPREMLPNPAVSEKIWDKFLSLPSQSLPQRVAKPIKRLTALAHELAVDGLLADAGKKAHAEMHKMLDAAQARYAEEVATARKSVLAVEGLALRADLRSGEATFEHFVETADYVVIEEAYRRAAREFSADVARTYAEYLASKDGQLDEEERLINAHVTIAALGLVPEVRKYLEAEADKVTKQWFEKYRVEIKSLSDERQDQYREIRRMTSQPQDIDLARPRFWLEPTVVRAADGSETPMATFERHLLCDQAGKFPIEFGSSWERDVLESEMARDGFVGWYRNPARSSQESLAIAYDVGGSYRLLRPDFLFFAQVPDGSIAADIVDPHGTHLSDALPKLKALARYAEEHAGTYRRIESIAKVGSELLLLDLTDAETRQAITSATSALGLYQGKAATPYL